MPEFPEKGFYYHYKHDPNGPIDHHSYEVIDIARHTEDESFLVIYLPIGEDSWIKPAVFAARPLSMFMESVTKDGKTFPRFAKITDPVVIAELTKIRDEMYS